MILGILEYCCPLWSPTDRESIEKIEKVQQTFTRKLDGFRGQQRPNYWERLKTLKIYSLERRRERYMILYVFKSLSGLVPNIGFIVKQNDRIGPKIEILKKRKESSVADSLFYRNFIIQGGKLFNILPKELRQCIGNSDINMIKRKLDNFLHNIPDQPSSANIPKVAESNSLVDQTKYV